MKDFVRSLCALIDNKEVFTLATVVESSGSTPRSSGAKMAVRSDGSIIGTVGGGLMEATACHEGKAMLGAGDGCASLQYVDMTQELAANSDMICGGGLSVLLEVVHPDGPCAATYQELDRLMRAGKPSLLLTHYQEAGGLHAASHAIKTDSDLSSSEINEMVFARTDEGLTLGEPFVPPAPLYIFGAGHVSLFTAKVAAMVGFRTVVIDDRAEYANEARFPEADELVVLDTFQGCCERLGVGEDAYVVIVTRGHLHDSTVLEEALKTKARYVGMIGSKSKRDKIYQALLSGGLSSTDIGRCHCPIGMTIGGQTPEEIAVSICAELINVRSGQGA